MTPLKDTASKPGDKPKSGDSGSAASHKAQAVPDRNDTPGNTIRIALVGNPNSGKTTVFNALTGLHQKVGNYPGVTVERKEGAYRHEETTYRLFDLPGTYSLSSISEDERIVRDLLLGLITMESPMDMAMVVVDASHIERHMFLATQIMDLGLPMVIALTMNDEATAKGHVVDAECLSRITGVPVVEVIVPKNKGVAKLKMVIKETVSVIPEPPPWSLGDKMLSVVDHLAGVIGVNHPAPLSYRRQLALHLLLDEKKEHPMFMLPGAREQVDTLQQELENSVEQWREAEARGRYDWIKEVCASSRAAAEKFKPSKSDRLDKIVTHPFWGLVVFAAIMAVVFQSIFSWAGPFMEVIDNFFGWLGTAVGELIPAGPLNGLLVDGVIGGVGGVLVFLPQILILFLFVVLLEDSGYMARAAFMMNRHMRRAGLHGRAFVPMLSGFACSVPALMAARTISDKRDKLVTMLVIPLVSCSARLPVYALVIAAFIPAVPVIKQVGGFTWQGLVLWSAYVFSLVSAITVAYLLRKTLLKGTAQPFILELPPYRIPHWRTVLTTMWERGKLFLTQAGTIILAVNIILWFLLTYPSNGEIETKYEGLRTVAETSLIGAELDARLAEINRLASAEQMSYSYGGRMGTAIEPVLKPLGFDWRIGIGIVGSLAAREVFVSTLAVVYGIGEADESDESLIDKIRNEFGLLVGIAIILFFILSCQCLATVAVMKRESNSWKWALFLFTYMTLLAYLVTFLFYQTSSRIWPELA